MSDSRNHYEVLGVSRDASEEAIKQAYRDLARRYHPDISPEDVTDASERFRRINEAYRVLSDPTERARYDRTLDRGGTNHSSGIPGTQAESATADWQSCYQAGIKATQRHNYKAAIAHYDRALQLHPNLAEIYSHRGFARFKLGDSQGAFADYTEALNLKPNLAEAHYHRGMTRFALGYSQSAIEDFNQALKLEPTHAEACYQRGRAYADLKERAAAAADFRQAAQLFRHRQDRMRTRMAQEAYQALGFSAVWLSNVGSLPKEAVKAAQLFLFNPLGGMLPAFAKLERFRAAQVAGIFALAAIGSGVLGWLMLSANLTNSRLANAPVNSLFLLGLVAFCNLAIASGAARLVLKRPGSVAGDLFVAGATLLPLGLSLLLVGSLSVLGLDGSVSTLFLLPFASCYTVLTLYSGCSQISNLSEAQSVPVAALMLIFSLFPFALL